MTQHHAITKLLIFFGISIVTGIQASAAEVQQIKEKKVLIKGDESLEVNTGDRVYLLNDHGKKVGLVEITKVNGTRVIGLIIKGKADKGMIVVKAGKSGGAGGSDGSGKPLMFAALAGVNMSSQSISLSNTAGVSESVTMSGMGFGVYALANYRLNTSIDLRGALGYQTFSTTGTSNRSLCTGASACTTSIGYLDGDLYGYYSFGGSTRFHAGLVVGLMMPMSSSSNALATSSISTILSYGASLGVDIGKIPVIIDYVMLPSSSNVTTSIIRGSAGYFF